MQIEPNALAKTTRVNLLFDFYEKLLTEKQQTFLKYYFHDDYSLGEIAAEFAISRQAVYDNVKRAEQALEGYEDKLGLVAKHLEMLPLLERVEGELAGLDERSELRQLLAELSRLLKMQ